MGKVSMPQGKGSQLHNRRDYEKIGKPIPDNIDSSKTDENIIIVDKDIRKAYQEIFGEALEQYNRKQKRADRKIKDYYDHIAKSKNGEKLFYEDVLQWGSKDDFDSLEMRQKAKSALEEYICTFEKRNPNLRLIGAYIHMDEASPHLHFDYIPVAHGYSRGLAVRNSLDKAMKEMGFIPENESRKNNATMLWKQSEREYFSEICKSIGLEVEIEQKSDRKNLTVDEYKEARDKMLSNIEQEKESIVAELKPLKELKTNTDKIANIDKKLPFGIVAVKKKDFEKIKKQAKAYIANRDEIKTLRERSMNVDQKEQLANQREHQLDNKEHELSQQQYQLDLLYQRQLNINRVLEKAERDIEVKNKQIKDLQAENSSLRGEIRSLTAQIDKIKESIGEKINTLTEKLTGAYTSLTNIVKAVGMLKYDKEDGYGVSNLTEKQERLIDGIAKYGIKWAEEDGFPSMAEDMEKHIGISDGIKDIIEPSMREISYDWDMEL